ncbi:HNH endonuclease [Edaphobacter modestus]|uniref:Putative restriction endonuclease n=1 Tax=Edaphobacter modestus TaxID=388466 RepID=A0A4Q7Y2S7_9BACT|nr:HNH endonuclease [Edaphobacter modestus]RZU30371.1 putative restriction endonuclease [Edaphobacter modestus]
MPRLAKARLRQVVLDALEASGYAIEYAGAVHPFEISVRTSLREERLLVYAWNITHGGKGRSADEYRIQITGVSHISFQKERKTLLLGVAELPESGTVIAAFDARSHKNFGSSPSIQVQAPTLLKAELDGLASETKELAGGHAEIVFAFRPENLGQFIETLYPVYHSAGSPLATTEAIKVNKLDFSKPNLDANDLTGVAANRKKALRTVARWVRDQNFRRNVMHVYGYRCAICGLQAKLVHGSHIVPVASGGTDETVNGLCLCVLHHEAYDRGLLAIDATGRILRNTAMVTALTKASLSSGLDAFFKVARVGQMIHLPADAKYAPRPDFLKKNLVIKGATNFA